MSRLVPTFLREEKIVPNLLHAVCIRIEVHNFPLAVAWFPVSHPSRFWVQCSFLSYLFFPAF